MRNVDIHAGMCKWSNLTYFKATKLKYKSGNDVVELNVFNLCFGFEELLTEMNEDIPVSERSMNEWKTIFSTHWKFVTQERYVCIYDYLHSLHAEKE